MKTRAILSVLVMMAAAAACGDKNEGETSGGMDTTATSGSMSTENTTTMPPAAPMATDSMGGMNGMGTDSAMGGTAGAGQTDTLVKVDSTKKM
ncbi:MAG TPA: hypothetical protein VFJ16_26760 [Longimicrobium sp.]|nr:hypothetical protein [Longimicrobium sp.]